ncbi:MAG: phospho-sugar mutase [Planctomycetaceae bacterium]|nr:phospho-sugar mutase [Planctomycetaceae bacterium]
MNNYSSTIEVSAAKEKVLEAQQSGKIADSAVTNIMTWLEDARYEKYRDGICQHIAEEQWQTLDDVFWTVIPFGTGGRRGMMYPFGSNAINERTIGESAQGLASYIKKVKPAGPWSFAIGYDTRHRSREFAELCAGIMVANGFTVYFIDDFRSTPELSYLIRYKQCDCGIMVTASHNPPSDNAVKVYWSSGAQLVPPHDKAVIDEVMDVGSFEIANFEEAVAAGQVVFCKEETDAALMAEHLKHTIDGPRDFKVIFSPLHGVGEFNVRTLLEAVGFQDVDIYGPHREPNGDFPNVPGHVSNPENPQVFAEIIEYAKTSGAELILASDPDCDRMGAAAPLTLDLTGEWKTLDGNQLGALLCDFVLSHRQQAGQATDSDYIVTTLVSSMMTTRIAEHYATHSYRENLVGFKWICDVVDKVGPQGFVFGTEESHGYLVGTYARDKDGAVACMLMAELAAECKSQGISLHQKLDQLYEKVGYHRERLSTIRMEGSDGMKRMQAMMDKLRSDGPQTIGGLSITAVDDYLAEETRWADGRTTELSGPQGNLIMMKTDIPGNYVAVRPSGTEPKVKMYMFTYVPPGELENLETAKTDMDDRLDAFDKDIRAFADTVTV